MADPLIGYEFDTEDGTARVTGHLNDSQYVTIIVTPSIRQGGKAFSSLRLRSMVEAHRAWKMGAMEQHPDTYPRGV